MSKMSDKLADLRKAIQSPARPPSDWPAEDFARAAHGLAELIARAPRSLGCELPSEEGVLVALVTWHDIPQTLGEVLLDLDRHLETLAGRGAPGLRTVLPSAGITPFFRPGSDWHAADLAGAIVAIWDMLQGDGTGAIVGETPVGDDENLNDDIEHRRKLVAVGCGELFTRAFALADALPKWEPPPDPTKDRVKEALATFLAPPALALGRSSEGQALRGLGRNLGNIAKGVAAGVPELPPYTALDHAVVETMVTAGRVKDLLGGDLLRDIDVEVLRLKYGDELTDDEIAKRLPPTKYGPRTSGGIGQQLRDIRGKLRDAFVTPALIKRVARATMGVATDHDRRTLDPLLRVGPAGLDLMLDEIRSGFLAFRDRPRPTFAKGKAGSPAYRDLISKRQKIWDFLNPKNDARRLAAVARALEGNPPPEDREWLIDLANQIAELVLPQPAVVIPSITQALAESPVN